MPSRIFDLQQATIRCLAHVIHLVVIDLLVSIQAMTKSDAEEASLDANGPHLMEDDVEGISGVDKDRESSLTDKEILENDLLSEMRKTVGQAMEHDVVDLAAVIQKVHACNHTYSFNYLVMTSYYFCQIHAISKLAHSSPQHQEDYLARITQWNDRIKCDNVDPSLILSLKMLILDVVTRWNSMYFMIERAYKYCMVCSHLWPFLCSQALKLMTIPDL